MNMNLYKGLELQVVQGNAEPAVWMCRITIFEQISPEPVIHGFLQVPIIGHGIKFR